MAKRRALVGGIVIAILLIISVVGVTIALSRRRIISNRFDTDLFENPNRLTLCFDLRDEDKLLSGLLINARADTTKGQHIVLLPFTSTEVQPNTRLLTTWGAHKTFTIVTYVATDRMGDSNGIGMAPRVPFYTLDEINVGANSRDVVYIIRAGLERRFIYKYPTADREFGNLPIETQLLIDNLDSIGVAIPGNAEFREVRPGFSEIPTNEYTNGNARFYAASAAKAGTDHIELRYAFKATGSQTLFVELALELIAAVIVPLVSLKALRPEEARNPKQRQVLIWGAIILQIVMIAGLVTYIWFTHEPGESELKAIGDAVIAVMGAIFGAVVIRMKAKE
jgi:hypothetical protein